MITNHPAVSVPVSDIQVNTYLLHSIFHRRKWLWALVGLIVFSTLFAFNLFRVAQPYAATVSISMQSAAGPTGLAALAGLGGGGKKYNGVLKSRAFAEAVENKVHLQSLLGMKQRADVLEFLSKNIKIDDNATDGLLYLTIEMNGPPRLAANADARRQQIKNATAATANAYADALRRYLIDSDTDRETVLMREAVKQFKVIDEQCNIKQNQLAAFVKGKRGESATLAAPSSSLQALAANVAASSGSPDSSDTAAMVGHNAGAIGAASSELAALLLKRNELQQQIAAAHKANEATTRILNNPASLDTLPDEDPILTEARRLVNARRSDLKTLQISLGDAHPSVIEAKERLALAERNLQEKIRSIRQGNTTAHVKITEMEEAYSQVQRQIKQAEANARIGRNASTDLERLRDDLTMWLEARKTLFNKLAEMRSQMVAGQNRMNIVDPALPPRYPRAGIVQGALISLLGALFVIVSWLAIEYFVSNSRRYAIARA